MTPEFSKAVDPVFLAVLDLLSRIQKQEHGDPADEHARIKRAIDRCEAALGADDDDWSLAKYALAAWADDVLYRAEWSGRHWWMHNYLEVEYFGPRVAAAEFFRKAKQAASLRTRNALEVFYVCVVLGFRGVYADEQLVADEQHNSPDLPASLGKWVKQTAMGIQPGLGRPPIVDNPQEGHGAPALRGKFHLIAAVFVMVALGGATVVLFNWAEDRAFWSKGSTEPVAESSSGDGS